MSMDSIQWVRVRACVCARALGPHTADDVWQNKTETPWSLQEEAVVCTCSYFLRGCNICILMFLINKRTSPYYSWHISKFRTLYINLLHSCQSCCAEKNESRPPDQWDVRIQQHGMTHWPSPCCLMTPRTWQKVLDSSCLVLIQFLEISSPNWFAEYICFNSSVWMYNITSDIKRWPYRICLD